MVQEETAAEPVVEARSNATIGAPEEESVESLEAAAALEDLRQLQKSGLPVSWPKNDKGH